MDDPVAHGHAFVVGDLWRAPSLLLQPDEQHDSSIFNPLDTSAPPPPPPPELLKPEQAPHFRFDTDLPGLPGLDEAVEPRVQADEASTPPTSSTVENDDLDLWNLDNASVEPPSDSALCTWEAFDGKSVANSQQTALLSEAGQFAFDALGSAAAEKSVLPQDYTLRALCSLAHGRASTLFHWSEKSDSFLPVIQGVTMSGISQVCTESLVKDMAEMGSSIVRLRNFGDIAYASRSSCPALVAMQNGIATILDAIDEMMCIELSAVHSLLQLQQLAVRPRQLLNGLVTLMESARDCKTDESLISTISDRIHALVETHQDFSAVLRAFLARISVPWLERLSIDLGLSITTPALVGAAMDSQSVEDFTKATHTFLNDIDIDLICETKIAVALLRQLSPSHPLLDHGSSTDEFGLESFTDPSVGLEQTGSLAQLYEIQALRRLTDNETNKQTVPGGSQIKRDLDIYRAEEPSSESYISGLEDLMSRNFDKQSPSSPDELYSLAGTVCQNHSVENKDRGLDLSACIASTPLERVRPFVKTQSRLVNGILLRQLMRRYQLRKQLDKQKQFQLMGNGNFVTRLSTALFSLDVQSAERKRGVIPTGEVMGLRLGSSADQRWPPASSELRLTLAGVLEESQDVPAAASENPADQYSALSFAIRELPEEEIERVLDVLSVHALDFLRLQYVPTSPLDAVLTPEAIQQYDVVFRYLLKLLRQVHMVKNLPRRKSGGRGVAADEKIIAFAIESHHFVSVLTSHSMEVGINAPWRALMISIEQLEQALCDEDIAGQIGTMATVGIQGLKQLHEACLDRIRGRLFLKRKHTKLRVAIEAVFTAILKSAAALPTHDSMDMSVFEEQCVLFRRACSNLSETLQQVVDKPPKVMTAAESEDADTIRVLLLRLNWNEFHASVRTEVTATT